MPATSVARSSSFQTLLKKLVTVRQHELAATVGVDIGSSGIKIVALGRGKGSGQRPVIGMERVPVSAKPDESAASLRAAVEKLHLPTKTIALSVSGPSVIMRVVEMPTLRPEDLKRALPFEAQRYLPFPVQDVILDGELLGSVDPKKAWVLVVACKKDLIAQRLDLARRAGLEVSFIDVDALAVANAFLEVGTAQRKTPTSAVINIGSQLTSVVIFKSTTPYLVRDIPWGAERLVKELSQQLGQDAAKVRQLLETAQPDDALRASLKEASESLLVELQLSFDYFENQLGHPPEEVFLTGGLSACQPFVDGMRQQLTQNLVVWEPAPGVTGPFSVAFGLALRTA